MRHFTVFQLFENNFSINGDTVLILNNLKTKDNGQNQAFNGILYVSVNS